MQTRSSRCQPDRWLRILLHFILGVTRCEQPDCRNHWPSLKNLHQHPRRRRRRRRQFCSSERSRSTRLAAHTNLISGVHSRASRLIISLMKAQVSDVRTDLITRFRDRSQSLSVDFLAHLRPHLIHPVLVMSRLLRFELDRATNILQIVKKPSTMVSGEGLIHKEVYVRLWHKINKFLDANTYNKLHQQNESSVYLFIYLFA